MTGIEPRISGVVSDRSTDWATTDSAFYKCNLRIHKLQPKCIQCMPQTFPDEQSRKTVKEKISKLAFSKIGFGPRMNEPEAVRNGCQKSYTARLIAKLKVLKKKNEINIFDKRDSSRTAQNVSMSSEIILQLCGVLTRNSWELFLFQLTIIISAKVRGFDTIAIYYGC